MEGCPKPLMISFDLKEPAQLDDLFEKPLKQYIEEFYHESGSSYEQEIKQITQLRKSLSSLPRDKQGCSVLRRYYTQLHYLQSRFPMGEGGSAATIFVWYDYNFEPVSYKDIRFEQACVLYTLAALYSHLGTNESRTSEESMKTALTHFQSAAGVFQFLRDNFSLSDFPDMSEAILELKCKIMLGQAEECILEKSMADDHNVTLIARICMQVIEYFTDAIAAFKNPGTGEIDSSIEKSWTKYLTIKINMYYALAYSYMSNDADKESKYGEKVSYLNAAKDKIEQSMKLAKKQKEGIVETVNFVSDVVLQKHEAGVKENDFIYHQATPDIATLPTIEPVNLVKALPFNYEDNTNAGPDIFQKLVPMKAHESASLYSEVKDNLMRETSKLAEEKDVQLSEFMTALKVEELLDPPQEILPDELIAKNQFLRDNPDLMSRVEKDIEELSLVTSSVEGMLREINENLMEELLELTNNNREEYAELCKEKETCHSAHSMANQTNDELCKHYVDNKQMIVFLSGDQILKSLPSQHVVDGTSTSEPVVRRIREILGKVEKMKTQRASFLTQLRTELGKDDVTSRIVVRDSGNLQNFFEEELKKHDKTLEKINLNLTAQDNILQALTEANANYATTREEFSAVQKRFDLQVQSYVGLVSVFLEVKDRLREGLSFYKDLKLNVETLRGKVQLFFNGNKKKIKSNQPPARPTAQKPSLSNVPHQNIIPGGHPLIRMPPRGQLPYQRMPQTLPPGHPKNITGHLQSGHQIPGNMGQPPRQQFPQQTPHMPQQISPQQLPPQCHPQISQGQPPRPHLQWPQMPPPQRPQATSQQTPQMQPPNPQQMNSKQNLPINSSIPHTNALNPQQHRPRHIPPVSNPAATSMMYPGPHQLRLRFSTPSERPSFQPRPPVQTLDPSKQDPRSFSPAAGQRMMPQRQPPGQDGMVRHPNDPRMMLRPCTPEPQSLPMGERPRQPWNFMPRMNLGPATPHMHAQMHPQRPTNHIPNLQSNFQRPQNYSASPGQFPQQTPSPIMMRPNFPMPSNRQPFPQQTISSPNLPIQHRLPHNRLYNQQNQQPVFRAPAQPNNNQSLPELPPPLIPLNISEKESLSENPHHNQQQQNQPFSTQPENQQPDQIRPQQQNRIRPQHINQKQQQLPQHQQNQFLQQNPRQQLNQQQILASNLQQLNRQQIPVRQPVTYNDPAQETVQPFEPQTFPQSTMLKPAAPLQQSRPVMQPTAPTAPPPQQHEPVLMPYAGPIVSKQPGGVLYSAKPQMSASTDSMINNILGGGNKNNTAEISQLGFQQFQLQQVVLQQQQLIAMMQNQQTMQHTEEKTKIETLQAQIVGQQKMMDSLLEKTTTEEEKKQEQHHKTDEQKLILEQQNIILKMLEEKERDKASKKNNDLAKSNLPTASILQPSPVNQINQQPFALQPFYEPKTDSKCVVPTVISMTSADVLPHQQISVEEIVRSRNLDGMNPRLEESQTPSVPDKFDDNTHVENVNYNESQGLTKEDEISIQKQNNDKELENKKASQLNVIPSEKLSHELISNNKSNADDKSNILDIIANKNSPELQLNSRVIEDYTREAPKLRINSTDILDDVDDGAPKLQVNSTDVDASVSPPPPTRKTELVFTSPDPDSGLHLTPKGGEGAVLIPTPTSLATGATFLSLSAVRLEDVDGVDYRGDHRPDLERQLGRLSVYRPEPDAKQWQIYMDELEGSVNKLQARCRTLCRPLSDDRSIDGFAAEWQDLEKVEKLDVSNYTSMSGDDNTTKNRYRDILPWDHTRVKLKSLPNDYINASHIENLSPHSPRYVATQGPIPQTFEDFWTMVWELRSSVIVMLTKEVESHKLKCHPYWNRVLEEPVDFGSMVVIMMKEEDLVCWKLRTFTLLNKKSDDTRVVKQLQFTSWPDHCTPDQASELLMLMEEVHRCHQLMDPSLAYPLILHCSAGVGRTGAFCCIYSAIKEIQGQNGLIEVKGVLRKLRQCRPHMVQRKEQLIFCYQAILYYAQQFIATERLKLEKAPPSSAMATVMGDDELFTSASADSLKFNAPKPLPATSIETSYPRSILKKVERTRDIVDSLKDVAAGNAALDLHHLHDDVIANVPSKQEVPVGPKDEEMVTSDIEVKTIAEVSSLNEDTVEISDDETERRKFVDEEAAKTDQIDSPDVSNIDNADLPKHDISNEDVTNNPCTINIPVQECDNDVIEAKDVIAVDELEIYDANTTTPKDTPKFKINSDIFQSPRHASEKDATPEEE